MTLEADSGPAAVTDPGASVAYEAPVPAPSAYLTVTSSSTRSVTSSTRSRNVLTPSTVGDRSSSRLARSAPGPPGRGSSARDGRKWPVRSGADPPRSAYIRNVADKPSVDQIRAYLMGESPMLAEQRKRFKRLPSDPRCKLCLVPFKGIGAMAMKPLGYGQSPGNPAMCNKCIVELRKQGVDLVVWSEAGVARSFSENNYQAQVKNRLTGRLKVPTLVGTVLRGRVPNPTPKGRQIQYFNTALMADAQGNVTGRYELLSEGGERIGYQDWYQWGADILLANQQQDGSWQGEYGTGGADTAFALLFLKKFGGSKAIFSQRG